MKVIGLTGGIASGKSTASSVLSKLGAKIIDADKVGHGIYIPNTDAWKDIIETFGNDLLLPDKTINRKKLGEIVFNDKEAVKKLNQIVHPRMYKNFEQTIDTFNKENNGKGVIVLDAAILIEAKWLPLVDEVWLVIADEETVIKRLCEKGFTKEHARARIASQLSDEERKKHADIIIENSDSVANLKKRVNELWTGRINQT